MQVGSGGNVGDTIVDLPSGISLANIAQLVINGGKVTIKGASNVGGDILLNGGELWVEDTAAWTGNLIVNGGTVFDAASGSTGAVIGNGGKIDGTRTTRTRTYGKFEAFQGFTADFNDGATDSTVFTDGLFNYGGQIMTTPGTKYTFA